MLNTDGQGHRVENAQPSRLPARLLIFVMCLVGLCALPSAVMFLGMGIAGGMATVPLLVAPLFAYPFVVWL
ncbi:hypothetical protein Aca07nite_64690 [Actinoplanes capillaceus]|uniref:Uncharacterized protein n=1 Tax=Actinoplanes campanulatus TaxID=113559 RepID=A0ABQ3WSH0_9ACTN|nr:hypothetical protein [Actinoplanes capillaceus]GID49194.1 hypothetical protein Aca07nite_64690 [Actinoplanes capillaceus]